MFVKGEMLRDNIFNNRSLIFSDYDPVFKLKLTPYMSSYFKHVKIFRFKIHVSN